MLTPTLQNYLLELDRRLSPMPISERQDIISEIYSQIEEQLAQGITSEQILLNFGPCGELANSYLGDYMFRASTPRQGYTSRLFKFIANAGLAGLVVLPTAIPTAIAGLIGCIICLLLLLVYITCSLIGVDYPFAFALSYPGSHSLLKDIFSLLVGTVICGLLAVVFWWITIFYIRWLRRQYQRIDYPDYRPHPGHTGQSLFRRRKGTIITISLALLAVIIGLGFTASWFLTTSTDKIKVAREIGLDPLPMNYHAVEISTEKDQLNNKFKPNKPIYLFVYREQAEEGFKANKCRINGQPFTNYSSDFNIPSPKNWWPVFLEGKITLEKANSYTFECKDYDTKVVIAQKK